MPKQQSNSRKKDPNALKKPHNMFILYKLDNKLQFRKDYEEYLNAHKGSSPSKEIHQQSLIQASRLLGARWRNESVEVKQKYREASNKLIVAHHQELKARNAQALLEQQRRKEEARATGRVDGALQWQNHAPLPYCAPPFVEGGSSQAGFMPQAFQGPATVPSLGQIPVGGPNWNLTPGPIRNQRALPASSAFPVRTRFAPYARPVYRAPNFDPPSEQTVLPGFQNIGGSMIAPSGFMQIPQGRLSYHIPRRNVGGQDANSSADALLLPGVQLNPSQQLPSLDEIGSQVFGHTTAGHGLNEPQQFINPQNAQVIGQPNQLHQPISIGEQNGRIQTFDARALSGRTAGSSSAVPFDSSVVLPTSFQTSQDFPPLQNDYAPRLLPQARWNNLAALTLNQINGSSDMDQNFADDQNPFRIASPNFDRILPQIFHPPRNNSASVPPQDVHRTVPRALGSFNYYGQHL